MKHQVILREFRPQDTDALADIIRITWGYDKFGSHETACKLARAYLDLCLTNQTYTQVAIVDGVPVGIIMGKNIREHKCPEQLSIRQKQSMEDLCATQEEEEMLLNFIKQSARLMTHCSNSVKKHIKGSCFLRSKCGIQRPWYWRKII